MVKRKSRAEIRVPDGAGGMVKLTDRRFEPGDWPVQFEILDQHAGTWMRYLAAACEKRGWGLSSLGQHERREESGTLTVTPQPRMAPLSIVWDRKRGGAMVVRARCEASSGVPVSELRALLEDVSARCVSQHTERFFRWGCLEFWGLPWLGELWLDDKLQLGPPSTQDQSALYGPRAIIVSAMVKAVSLGDSAYVFDKEIRELSAFLSVVMAINVDRPDQHRTWTWEIGTGGRTVSSPRQLGYVEPNPPTEMAARGTCRAVPLYPISRPGIHERNGIENEMMLPADVAALWAHYHALSNEQRSKFLQVASKWQEALIHWKDRDTLSFTLMVVACEALKPSDKEFKDYTVDDVVEALLGAPTAQRIKQDWFHAHLVRSEHVHLAELRGSEFQLRTMSGSYDPTFDEARRELFRITNAATIEWLRRDGNFALPTIKRPVTLRRFMRQNFFVMLAVALVIGIAIGWLLQGIMS